MSTMRKLREIAQTTMGVFVICQEDAEEDDELGAVGTLVEGVREEPLL